MSSQAALLTFISFDKLLPSSALTNLATEASDPNLSVLQPMAESCFYTRNGKQMEKFGLFPLTYLILFDLITLILMQKSTK